MRNFRLQVFRSVAQHLNFRKAAEELRLTQPAVSQQIKALEEELGFLLFDRGGGRIALTQGGSTLLEYVERLDRLLDETEGALAPFRGDLRGSLTIGASLTIAQYLLPRLLGPFLRNNPKVEIGISTRNTEQIVDALAERHIALGLIEGPARRRDIKVQPILRDEMVLVASPSLRFVESSTISIDDLRSLPMLVRERGSGSRHVVEAALEQAGIRPSDLRIVLELDTTEAIKSSVEAGLGVAFVSRWTIRKELRFGTICAVAVDGLEIGRDLSLAYASGPEPTGLAGAFAAFVRAHSPLL